MLQVHVKRDDLGTTRAATIPPSPLADGAVRLQLELFGLSANNVTYAAMGEGFAGYWDFFPAPQGWGCPPCWGFAKVVESHASDIATGSRYYGYFPIAETLDVLPVKVSGSGFTDGAPHREKKAAVYNRYLITTADPLYDPAFEPEQVLLRPTFASGWWLADFIHQGKPAAVVMSSASSKSAIATASQLRRLGGNHQLIGLTSERNSSFVHDTALYDDVLTYENVGSLSTRGPTTYADFLGRESLTAAVHNVLGERLTRSVLFGATDWSDKTGGVRPPSVALRGPTPEIFFTPGYRDQRHREDPAVGAAMPADMRAFYPASRKFLTIRDIRGADQILSCWKQLVSGDVSPKDGLAPRF
jgi:hypothetical protein